MRWLYKNKLIWKNDSKYRIKWDRKAPSKIAQYVKDYIKVVFPFDVWMEEYVLPGGRLRVDFLNVTRNFAIEVAGKQHYEYIKFFHKDRLGYGESFKRDLVKAQFLEDNGFNVIEIRDEDLPLTKEFFKKRNILV